MNTRVSLRLKRLLSKTVEGRSCEQKRETIITERYIAVADATRQGVLRLRFFTALALSTLKMPFDMSDTDEFIWVGGATSRQCEVWDGYCAVVIIRIV